MIEVQSEYNIVERRYELTVTNGVFTFVTYVTPIMVEDHAFFSKLLKVIIEKSIQMDREVQI